MKLVQIFKRLHKWFALLVGLQSILWIVSGIAFSFINHERIEGDFIFESQHKRQSKSLSNMMNFQNILHKYPMATNIKQFILHGHHVVRVTTELKLLLLDVSSMEVIHVDKRLINEIAQTDYQGDGSLKTIQLQTERTDYNRKFSLPIWKVSFDDKYDTALYFSSTSGEYRGTRTNSWRLNDFFLMLHFMDYGQRGSFNHWLIIFAAFVLTFFSISGLLLIYSSFSRKDLSHIYTHFFSHNLVKLTILDEHGGSRVLKIEKDERLMDALASNKIDIDSVCGGGGICGCCRVKLIGSEHQGAQNKRMLENLDNHDTLSEEELCQGYRLACQLSVISDITIQM